MAIALVAVAAFVLLKQNGNDAGHAATEFAKDWTSGQLDKTQYVGLTGANVATSYKTAAGAMTGATVHVTSAGTRSSGNTAVTTLNVKWTITDAPPWQYDTTAMLSKVGGHWQVQWKPSVVYSPLSDGDSLSVQRIQPTRADILGADGTALVTARPVVEVGVVPERVTDVDKLSTQLATLLKIDGPTLAKQIRAAKPDQFVSVITLRREDYDALKAQLQPLPGTAFHERTLPLSPSRPFASALLGRVGPVTAEIVTASKGKYENGDIAGLSGLEQQYDSQLAGVASLQVKLTKADTTLSIAYAANAQPGQALQTTIDTKTQNAAESAIANADKPTSLVALQPSTGHVLAVANGPDVNGQDRALTAQYPPGSSFKVLTTYALLQKGVQPNDNVPCPPSITVNGKSFANAEHESFASAPFHTDFAESCNAAFVSLAPKLDDDTLANTASAFGLTKKWNAGPATFSGDVPTATDPVDLAAESFGQGRLLASPLAMASVAGSVQAGQWHQPVIVTDPSVTPLPTQSLDPTITGELQTLMREVVTSGTGTAVAKVPGDDVSGKTGTAEFGTNNPPQTHAWFIGYQGDLAFAVVVEGGGFGGDVAAPIAAKFLTALAK